MKNKDCSYKKGLNYKENVSEYAFRIKKRNWKFLWLLLALLPLLLLFVRCERDINVKTVDAVSGDPVSEVVVTVGYTSHFLVKNGTPFYNERIEQSLVTDGEGNGKFEKLPCSVYSYVFFCLSRAAYTAYSPDYYLRPDPEHSLFHFTWKKKLKLYLPQTDLGLVVVDKDTEEALAGAEIIYQYDHDGKISKGSVKTAADGTCTLKGIPESGTLLLNHVSCYGYRDTSAIQLDIAKAKANSELAKIRLEPLKTSFTFFVKNKVTGEPIPEATARVTLTSSGGSITRGVSVTNVDGRGVGAYDNAFVLANLDIKAFKPHFKDGTLRKNFTVEEFAAASVDDRTIYLEPEPDLLEFRNVDSLSGAPIAGVKNVIVKHGANGKTESRTEISNSNGIFYVEAYEGDILDIVSENKPYHETKRTHVDNFTDSHIIKMMPVMVDLTFRTLDAIEDEILPECSLSIYTSESNVREPENSGSGIFQVKNLRLSETISILASKQGYEPNGEKINNTSVADLHYAGQERRDIPLSLPPCDSGGDEVVKRNKLESVKSYNMGIPRGRFMFDWDTGTADPDQILVYNCKESEISTSSPIFNSGYVAASGQEWLTFYNGPVITVVAISGPASSTVWNYHVRCPE